MNPIQKSILDHLNSLYPHGHNAHTFDEDMAAQLGISVEQVIGHRDVLIEDGLIEVKDGDTYVGEQNYVLATKGFKKANP